MQITEFALELCDFLREQPEIRSCKLYGSISQGCFDEYSDVDIEIDVSGHDNGQFLLQLPTLLTRRYDVIFHDFAPSLAPEKYVVTFALQTDNPFALVDIACVATPHCSSVTRQTLSALNTLYDHTLKLFSANLKHHLRQSDCHAAILRMYRRLFDTPVPTDDRQMLTDVFDWLLLYAKPQHIALLDAYKPYLDRA